MPTTSLKNRFSVVLSLTVSVVLTLALTPDAIAKDILLKIGVIQRFGEETSDKLTLSSTSNDILTLKFKNDTNQPQTLQTSQIKLEVVNQNLKMAVVEERVVLSNHATFETAENSANFWRKQGIKVEITQPERWQVWAKRNVYQTPLLRRWLIQSLKDKGYTEPYLETAILEQKPQISFVVKGVRYFPQELEIQSSQNLIQISQTAEPARLYSGNLKLQVNAYGTYTLVNQVPLETYLRGVVPYEIGQDAPENATKAQAIIARTYALRNLRRFQADNYELCADTHCQVYYGLTGANPKTDQAIATTKGLVLTYENELVDALYSSTTGGVTATFSDVWDGEERPYLKAVVDSPGQIWDLSKQPLADEATFRHFISLKEGFNETGRTVFRWNKESTIAELNKDLKKYLARRKHPLANFTTIYGMEITKRSSSGRILTMTVQTDKGVLELYKNEVRSAFGPPRSTLFYIEPIYDANQKLKAYAFIGGGFGHGVGLSQTGSYNLAKLGWTAERILAFYYPGTKIQPLNDSIIFWRGKE